MKMTLKRAIMKVGSDVSINIYVDGKFLISNYSATYEVFVNKFADTLIYATEYNYFNGELTCASIKINSEELYK